MRYTTFTEAEEQRLIHECLLALVNGTTPPSELTDQLLALPDFGFLRDRLATAGRQVAMHCVGNPLGTASPRLLSGSPSMPAEHS